MRVLSVFLIGSLLLAGCASNDDSADGGKTTTTTTTTGPPPAPVVTTDMLHLLEVPVLATALPASGSEIATPVPSGNFGGGGGGGGNNAPTWTYQVKTPVNVSTGEIRIWIRITETLVQSPAVFPGQSSCTWVVRLELGVGNNMNVPCLTEPPGPISAATKELVFSFTGQSATQLETNETVSVRFERRAFSASTNQSPVFVLSGTPERDSHVKINGLKEPVVAP
jgi:hypothetical protein